MCLKDGKLLVLPYNSSERQYLVNLIYFLPDFPYYPQELYPLASSVYNLTSLS